MQYLVSDWKEKNYCIEVENGWQYYSQSKTKGMAKYNKYGQVYQSCLKLNMTWFSVINCLMQYLSFSLDLEKGEFSSLEVQQFYHF